MAPQPLSIRAGLILASVTMLVIAGSCAMVVRSFVNEERGAHDLVSTLPPGTKDYVRIEGYIASIDPVMGRMTVELYFYPKGRFDAGGGLLSAPIEVEVSSMGGESLQFESDRRMFPRSVEIGFLDGAVADYPVDIHHALIELRVLELTGGKGGQIAVPVEFDLDSHFHGFALGETPVTSLKNGYIGAEVELRRSRLVLGTVIFCMLVIWALTGMNLLMLWAVLTRRMEVDIETFAYMSGMIVALYFFREVLPDAPPFLGVLADYMAFFWAELITAVCAAIFAMLWYRQLVKRPAGVTAPPWSLPGGKEPD